MSGHGNPAPWEPARNPAGSPPPHLAKGTLHMSEARPASVTPGHKLSVEAPLTARPATRPDEGPELAGEPVGKLQAAVREPQPLPLLLYQGLKAPDSFFGDRQGDRRGGPPRGRRPVVQELRKAGLRDLELAVRSPLRL